MSGRRVRARAIVRTLLIALPVALLALVLGANAAPLEAQIISPGKLSAAHASLDGMSNCTQCHELGKKGASDAKCLGCHENLAARIQLKQGLHATYKGQTCGSCHKDHFGAAFQLVRFDTAGFDHSKVGFELKLAHKETKCRSCHTADLIADPAVRKYGMEHRTLAKTYLGLATGCMDCHRKDDIHAGQFKTRKCTDCHTEASWKEVPLFNHDLTRYKLTGAHKDAQCEKCHRPMPVPGVDKPVTRFAGVASARCTSCHRDYHDGKMRQTCESCHNTDSWTRLTDRKGFESTFDHSRTKFMLNGAHAKSTCATCHTPSAPPKGTVRLTFAPENLKSMFPAPRAADCMSCHVDVHEGTFAKSTGGPACKNCHTESTWLPAAYDLARHNRETFVLTGAHIATPCSSCHPTATVGKPPTFKVASRECVACHKAKDPHQGQFAERPCTDCHTTESFRIAAFDHAKTKYPLDATHRAVACAGCHIKTSGASGSTFTRYRPLETTCRSCHGTQAPRRP